MSKVKLDQSKCVGCGACVSIAGNNFAFDDGDFISKVINDEVTDEAIAASESCPVYAITIEEDEEETTEEN